MKLIAKLLIISLLFISGCNYQIFNSKSTYDEIVKSAFENKDYRVNTSGTAFTYYLPNNMSVSSSNDYVTTLTSDSLSIYLSVNLVNYLLATDQIIKTKQNEYEVYSKEKAKDSIEVETQLELINNSIVDPIYQFSNDKGTVIITSEGKSIYNIYVVNDYTVISTSTNETHVNEALYKSISLFNSVNITDNVALSYVIEPPTTISSAEIISLNNSNDSLGIQIIKKYNYDLSVSFDTNNDFEDVFVLPGEEIIEEK